MAGRATAVSGGREPRHRPLSPLQAAAQGEEEGGWGQGLCVRRRLCLEQLNQSGGGGFEGATRSHILGVTSGVTVYIPGIPYIHPQLLLPLPPSPRT